MTEQSNLFEGLEDLSALDLGRIQKLIESISSFAASVTNDTDPKDIETVINWQWNRIVEESEVPFPEPPDRRQMREAGLTPVEERIVYFLHTYQLMLNSRYGENEVSEREMESAMDWLVTKGEERIRKSIELRPKPVIFPAQKKRGGKAVIAHPGSCVYIIGCEGQPDIYKIGITDNISHRLQSIATNNAFKPYVVRTFQTPDPYVIESEMHRQFAGKRFHHEWFKFDDIDVINVIDACETLIAEQLENGNEESA